MRDLKKRTVYGIGYLGNGKYKTREAGKIKKYYTSWVYMFKCYSEDFLSKHPHIKKYKVCVKWHNLQTFAKWYEENYVEGYIFDANILSDGSNTYSPDTCCFVPRDVKQFMLNKRIKQNKNLPTGVSFNKRAKKYCVHMGEFKSKLPSFIRQFNTIKEAEKVYTEHRKKISEEVKLYCRLIGLDDRIISRIK